MFVFMVFKIWLHVGFIDVTTVYILFTVIRFPTEALKMRLFHNHQGRVCGSYCSAVIQMVLLKPPVRFSHEYKHTGDCYQCRNKDKDLCERKGNYGKDQLSKYAWTECEECNKNRWRLL